MQLQLTKHFKLSEATKSDTADKLGLSNEPDATDLATIHRTAQRMETVRQILGGHPIKITSWYRNEKVNKAVGGVSNSQHRKGEAVDFQIANKSPFRIVETLKQHQAELQYDQLILEPGWVHISFLTSHANKNKSPRLQYLDYTK